MFFRSLGKDWVVIVVMLLPAGGARMRPEKRAKLTLDAFT
jgi:hypothetical protein